MKSQKLAIGIFGHYGNKNLGDEAIIEAVIQQIRKRKPETKIYGFSIIPEDTLQRHDIESFPIRHRPNSPAETQVTANSDAAEEQVKPIDKPHHTKQGMLSKLKGFAKKIYFIRQIIKAPLHLIKWVNGIRKEISFLILSYNRVKKLDILMITGSNQFLDNFGGPWGFPYTLLKWSVLAKLAGTKVFFVSVGAGPISQNLSKFLIRRTLRFADYVSLRDLSSEKLIHDIGCKKTTHVFPDIAHSLEIKHIKAATLPPKVVANNSPVIGINPMPLYDPRYWCEKEDSKYQTYVSKLTEFCSKLIMEGYPFFFFATQDKDNNVIYDVLNKLEDRHNQAFDFADYALRSSTVNDLMANIAAADITIATRFHGTVLSLLAEKPMLGICYYRKAKELLADMGQAEYAVELDTFSVDELWEKFKSLVKNLPIEKNKIKHKNEQYSVSLDLQYDTLLENGVV